MPHVDHAWHYFPQLRAVEIEQAQLPRLQPRVVGCLRANRRCKGHTRPKSLHAIAPRMLIDPFVRHPSHRGRVRAGWPFMNSRRTPVWYGQNSKPYRPGTVGACQDEVWRGR
jgi:hypothetical protein